MEWLVRLVTPPGGLVLEPFAGSGTTVEACITQGFRCVAIEREADYLPLILERIRRSATSVVTEQPPVSGDVPLFEEPAKPAGRWPTNVVMDRSQATELDEQGPHTKDGVAVNRNADGGRKKANVYGDYGNPARDDVTYGGEGGPSRFFPVFDNDLALFDFEEPA